MRSGTLRRTVCRAIAGPVLLTLLAGAAVAAPADTKRKISDAQRRLATLAGQIASTQARVLAMQTSMKALAAQVGTSRRQYEAIRDRVALTRRLRAEVEVRYQAVRREIGAAAANAYMRGPGYGIEALMALESLSDAAYVLAYTEAIARRGADLAARAQVLAAELRKRDAQESALRARRAAALSRLAENQAALTEAFAAQQARLAEMADARAEVGSLLARLRTQLRAEEIAAAEAALNGTPLSFGRWAEHLLSALRAPVARNNLVVIVAWQTAEYTTARWNPLATTQAMPGSTMFNSSRVRNYVSLAQGLEATVKTLRHTGYGYETILADLARNADPMTTARAINASRWCSGCAGGGYVVDLIASVEQYYDRYANNRA